MTDAYEHQNFYQNINNLSIIDCRDISGTRCYLDDTSKEEIISRLTDYSPTGIHFIDSGNYHYLSLLWLQKINYDFNLVLFDHHPDNQPPSFGDITSCGGWVLEATDTLPHLKNVYTFGVGNEIPASNIDNNLPIFISIDKDVLDPAFAITDWDQGDMSLDALLETLSIICKNSQIIGVDICGDSGDNTEKSIVVNSQTNKTLFDFLSANF